MSFRQIKKKIYPSSDWVEILWGFTKFFFKQMLKSPAFYLVKQKSVIPKKIWFRPYSISKQKSFVYWPNFQRRFCKYTSAFYEGILSVCLIWGSGLEAVSHAQMDARSVIHNAFFLFSYIAQKSPLTHNALNKYCKFLINYLLHEKYMWIKSWNMYSSVPNRRLFWISIQDRNCLRNLLAYRPD